VGRARSVNKTPQLSKVRKTASIRGSREKVHSELLKSENIFLGAKILFCKHRREVLPAQVAVKSRLKAVWLGRMYFAVLLQSPGSIQKSSLRPAAERTP
jgi:hypothetical protein